MYSALLIALFGGGLAAIANVLFNLYVKISDRKLDTKIKELNALTSVEHLICNLGSVKPLDINNYNYYHSIFDDINSIELYLNSIRLNNQNRFYLPKSILDKLQKFEAVFQDILTAYYVNQGNEDLTLLHIGAENFIVISSIKKELRGFIDDELRKLKK